MASASQRQRKSKSGHVLAVALNIGSDHSSCAFSLSHEYEIDPTKPLGVNWKINGLNRTKTPSVLLLSPDKTFISFGYEAEDEYADLVEKGEHNDYYYFRSFSALFDSQRLTPDMLIEDVKGKKLRAIFVFSLSINYLKSRLFEILPKRYPYIEYIDIMWVLTAPAIWNDEDKEFLRKAAQEAGIRAKHLLIALEPEAASLFFMDIPIDRNNLIGSSTNISPFQPGNKYMVVHVGASCVYITVYQVVDSDKLKEIYLYHSENSGERLVDQAFKRFLIRLLGDAVYEKIEMEYIEDFTDVYREFEMRKRMMCPDRVRKQTLRIPSIFADTYRKVEQKRLRDEVHEKLNDKVTLIDGNRLKIDASLVRSWFDEPIKKIVEPVQKLLQYQTCKDVSTILLVGEFSDSPMLQDAMKTRFPDKTLIIHELVGLVVLTGAVIFGHNPVTVVPRAAEFSFGVLVYRNFQKGIHPVSKKTNVAGKIKCKDVFATIVEKGQKLVEGKSIFNRRYTPLEANQMTFIFDIYKSPDKEPKFVTDPGCIYVGRLEVEVPDLSGGRERGVWVQMIHIDNEFIVEARDEKTGKITKASLQDCSQSSDAE